MTRKMGPMRCKQMLAQLSSYIDAELDAADCDRLEAHLSDCPPCVEFIKTLRKTVGVLRACGRGSVPARAQEGLRTKLKACAARLKKR